MKHLYKFYLILLISVIVAIGYLYYSLEQTQKELQTNIDTLFLHQAKEFANNIQKQIYQEIDDDIYEVLQHDTHKRHDIERMLSTMTTSSYKYIFLLYRDKDGYYRYLADGSQEDRGEFNERLNVDRTLWDRVYQTQKPQFIVQKKLEMLWTTYLTPIIFHNKTQAVLAIDFSRNLPQSIKHATAPLENIFLYIFAAIFLLLLIVLYQSIVTMRTKKDAITDPLTQAYNRNYLRDILGSINISHYQIIMLDIDYFKQVNDTYGHKIGDNILQDVATLIQSTIRSDDIFIRFGGEEFLLFIRKRNHENRLAYKVAQRIRKAIEQKLFVYDEIALHITVSLGVSCFPERFKSINAAIKYADEMLYIAKKEGRNQVVTQPKEQHASVQLQKVIPMNTIKDAIENGRILCEYQPIFHTDTKKLAKYEALVRIQDENGTMIYPGSFLDSIIHTNLYNQITKAILEIVFAAILKHKVPMSLNLNFSDIINVDIFSLIIEELEKHKELASWLTIELLEYEPLQTTHTFSKNLDIIKTYGVTVAIDDFGSGFANYSVLQIDAVDIIKIDGGLIKEIDTSKTSRKIVHSIIMLTKQLEIHTVAEFVHSQEVYEIVKAMGVDTVQGFYLAKPQKLDYN